MAISKNKKQQLVADYAEKVARSQAVILADYQGLDVARMGELRNRLRTTGTGCQVIKNTLLRRALQEADLPELDALLEGPTAASFCYEDVQRVTQMLVEFSREGSPFRLKGGLMGRRLLSREDVTRLASLPSRDVLLAQVLTGFQSPVRGLVTVLSGPMRGLATVLKARADQLAPTDN